jgi:hypothetical protein
MSIQHRVTKVEKTKGGWLVYIGLSYYFIGSKRLPAAPKKGDTLVTSDPPNSVVVSIDGHNIRQ